MVWESCLFAILITVSLSVDFFGFILFRTLCASWTWISVSFYRLRTFSAIISSNKCSAPFSLFSPFGTPIMQMLVCLMLSQKSLKLFSFLKMLFSFFCSAWVIFTTLSSRSLICSSVSSTADSF